MSVCGVCLFYCYMNFMSFTYMCFSSPLVHSLYALCSPSNNLNVYFANWNNIPRYRLIFRLNGKNDVFFFYFYIEWKNLFWITIEVRTDNNFDRQTEKATWLTQSEWLTHMQSGCSNVKYSFHIYLICFFISLLLDWKSLYSFAIVKQ